MNIRFYLEYLLLKLIVLLGSLIPRSVFLNIGRTLGMVAFTLVRNRAKMATQNIQSTIEPDHDKAKSIAKASFEHFGLVSFELLLTFIENQDKNYILDRFVASDEALARLHGYHEQTSGKIILVAAHIGNWEMLGKYLGANNIPIGVVGREINNPYINELVVRSRRTFGNILIEKGGAMMPLAKMLKGGQTVALLPDQKINDQNSAKVDFLGRPAGTTLSVAKLAKRFDAMMLPVAAIGVEGDKYTLIVGEPIAYEQDEDEIEITKKMNDALGDIIKAYPQQWFWMHNRWKQ